MQKTVVINAVGLENIRTVADADTKGAQTGRGVAIGLGWNADDPDATLTRNITGGTVNDLTLAVASGTAEATVVSGSAEGGKKEGETGASGHEV